MVDNADPRGSGRQRSEAPATASAVCTNCGAYLFSVTRLGDVQVAAVLDHLWDQHADVLSRPHTLPLDSLLGWVRLEPK